MNKIGIIRSNESGSVLGEVSINTNAKFIFEDDFVLDEIGIKIMHLCGGSACVAHWRDGGEPQMLKADDHDGEDREL